MDTFDHFFDYVTQNSLMYKTFAIIDFLIYFKYISIKHILTVLGKQAKLQYNNVIFTQILF